MVASLIYLEVNHSIENSLHPLIHSVYCREPLVNEKQRHQMKL
jgi:hypothetical protein